jgi:hypothetical protein
MARTVGYAICALGVTLLLASSGCINHLDKPAAPPPQPPRLNLPKTPPKEGYGRVYLDVPEAAADVDLYLGTGTQKGVVPIFVAGVIIMTPYEEAVDRFRRICVTPCIVDLPQGGQELKFSLRDESTRTDRSVVAFSDQPAAYLHTVGREDKNLATFLPSSIVFATGTALVLASPIVFAADKDDAGTKMLLAGGVLAAVGGFLMYLTRPVEQKGNGTQWVPQEWTAAGSR